MIANCLHDQRGETTFCKIVVSQSGSLRALTWTMNVSDVYSQYWHSSITISAAQVPKLSKWRVTWRFLSQLDEAIPLDSFESDLRMKIICHHLWRECRASLSYASWWSSKMQTQQIGCSWWICAAQWPTNCILPYWNQLQMSQFKLTIIASFL